MSKGMNPRDIMGDPQGSWELHIRENTASLDWKRVWSERSLSDPEIPQAGNRLIENCSAVSIWYLFWKWRMTQKVEPWARRAEPQTTEGYSQIWTQRVFALQELQIDLEWWLPFSFPFPFHPFWTRIFVTIILFLSPHCTLGADNVFP